MPLPQPEDRKQAEIDDLHACIMTKLRVLRFSGRTERDAADLRQRLQDYADAVVQFVNELP
jgi:hypothetical protein